MSTYIYKYKVEHCDVIDKDRLRLFREKRSDWIAWLSGSDAHTLWRQIHLLLWDYVLFSTVNDIRRHVADNPSEGVGFNSSVLRLFDTGFMTAQVIAIRRLSDQQPRDPSRGVISLRRLINEIRSSRELMTREVYVSYDGLPYDPSVVQAAWIRTQVETGDATATWLDPTGPNAWVPSDLMHKNFDKLSQKNSNERSRDDLINSQIFDWLDEKLDSCNDIRKFTDKFIAHAAEPASREGLTDEQVGVTLDRILQCHKAIYQVAAFIHGPLLYEGSVDPVPVPQFNHLENLDKAWISPDGNRRAHEIWRNNEDAIRRWKAESIWPG